jgi:tRNA(Ile)-lysidine synthase
MGNRALAFTAERLLHSLQSLPAVNTYVVGFSGGADSTALLHALCTVKSQLGTPFSAVHINHGIHEDADHWQMLCETFCRRNLVELITRRIRLENCSGKGLEAEARHLRYAAIADLLPPGAALLTAHHADDQAETLLLNLMRGSGVDGLSAMPESRPLGKGFLQRPLLGFQNRELKEYLRANDVEWIEDPSNQYLNHDRNFVRHEIIPLLEKRWPEVSQRLMLTRKAMTAARHLLEKLADDYLAQNLCHRFVLEMTSQLVDEPELFKLVIRRWMKRTDLPTVPAYRLESFYKQVRKHLNDHNVNVAWSGCLLRLYRQKLWLQPDVGVSPCPDVRWPEDSNEIDLGADVGLMRLTSAGTTGSRPGNLPGAHEVVLSRGDIAVGGRTNTTEAVISRGGQHKSLKNLFQQAAIPPWLRDSIPLCKLENEVVAMGDWCLSDRFGSWMSENNFKLGWHPRHPLLQFIRDQQHALAVDPVDAVR